MPDEWKKLQGFVRWWSENNPKPLIEPESLVYDETIGVSGHPDLVAEIAGRPTIVDYKAGNYLWPSMEIQVEVYGRLVEAQHGIKGAMRSLLHLTPRTKQGYSYRTFEPDDVKFNVFEALQAVFHYEHGENGPKAEAVPESLQINVEKPCDRNGNTPGASRRSGNQRR